MTRRERPLITRVSERALPAHVSLHAKLTEDIIVLISNIERVREIFNNLWFHSV